MKNLEIIIAWSTTTVHLLTCTCRLLINCSLAHVLAHMLIYSTAQQYTCGTAAYYNNRSTVDGVFEVFNKLPWIIMKGCYKKGHKEEIVSSWQRLTIINITKKRRNSSIQGTNQQRESSQPRQNIYHENVCGFPGGDRGGTSDAPLLSCKYRR